jgi:serine protease Do
LRNRILTFGAVMLVSLSLLIGCQSSGSRAEEHGKSGIVSEAQAQTSVKGGIPPSPFVAVAAKVMPAVVSIDTRKMVQSSGQGFQFEEPFGRMFRELIPQYPQRQEYEVPGYASGFIFDKRGYVVTNNHVVDEAEDITVRMLDGSEYKGRVVGRDPNTDVAILKIDMQGEPPVVPLGNSDQIQVGDWAIAVGNPFGRLQGTVTVGVISATGRSALNIVGGTPALQDFIQTDASINFGNSGGPLCDIEGEAIGMNTAINPLGQGIGFAIPMNMVKHVAEEIIKYGKVSWGYLGILPQEITNDIAEALGVQPRSGILVGQVMADTPAADAGVKTGDIITALNGEKMGNVDQFRLKVAQAGVGQDVKLTILRKGKTEDVTVKLAERPAEVSQAAKPEETKQEFLGIKVDDVNGPEGRQFAPSDVTKGIVIVNVDPGSPGENAGLAAGDVVEEINGQSVSSVSKYNSLIAEAKNRKDKPVLFLIMRDGSSRFVAVKPSLD